MSYRIREEYHRIMVRDDPNWTAKYMNSDHHADRKIRTFITYENITGVNVPECRFYATHGPAPPPPPPITYEMARGRRAYEPVDDDLDVYAASRKANRVSHNVFEDTGALQAQSRRHDQELMDDITAKMINVSTPAPVQVKRVYRKPPVAPLRRVSVPHVASRRLAPRVIALPVHSHRASSVPRSMVREVARPVFTIPEYHERQRVLRATSEPPLSHAHGPARLAPSTDLAVRQAKRCLSRIERDLTHDDIDDYLESPSIRTSRLPPRTPGHQVRYSYNDYDDDIDYVPVHTRTPRVVPRAGYTVVHDCDDEVASYLDLPPAPVVVAPYTRVAPGVSVSRYAAPRTGLVSITSSSVPSSPTLPRSSTSRFTDIQSEGKDRLDYLTPLESEVPQASLSDLRTRASQAKGKLDQHKVMMDRYLPLEDIGMPSLDPYRPGVSGSGSSVGSVAPYRPAEAAPHRDTYGSGGYRPSCRPPVSDTRKRCRQVLCKTKGDPNYFA